MNRRRKRRLPFAAYAALIFNAALCASPFIAARAISDAYGGKAPRPAFEGTSETLTATRQAMDYRLQQVARNAGAGSPREVWASMVRDRLDAGKMAAVNGLMLAAPAMIGGEDGEALKERIKVSDQTGDAAIIQAALAYLPEDVQDTYELNSGYAPAARLSAAATQAAVDQATAAKAAEAAKAPVSTIKGQPAKGQVAKAAEAAPAPPVERAQLAKANDASEEDSQVRLVALGSLGDLSTTAKHWSRQRNKDEFSFILSGVGLILADPEAYEGASILQLARRGKKTDPDFEAYLQRKLFTAAPPEKIMPVLESEFQSEFGYRETGPAVLESVFKSTVDREALESFFADLRIVRDIARDTTHVSAMEILTRVKDGSDLRRARLVAQAGGDRAVALAHYDGEHLLDTARVAVAWDNALKLQVAGLIACLVLLGFVALSTFWKSVTRDRPRKVSRVYAMMEEPAR